MRGKVRSEKVKGRRDFSLRRGENRTNGTYKTYRADMGLLLLLYVIMSSAIYIISLNLLVYVDAFAYVARLV